MWGRGCKRNNKSTQKHGQRNENFDRIRKHIMKNPLWPTLTTMLGMTLVTTDGTTLLGGDDKAGVAIIEITSGNPLLQLAHSSVSCQDVTVFLGTAYRTP